MQNLQETVLCLRREEEGGSKFCLPQLLPGPVLRPGDLGVQGEPQRVCDLSPQETRHHDTPEGASGRISQRPASTGSQKPRGGTLSEHPRNLHSRRRKRLFCTSVRDRAGPEDECCWEWRAGLQGGSVPGSGVTIIKDWFQGVPSSAEREVKSYNLLDGSRPLLEDEGSNSNKNLL